MKQYCLKLKKYLLPVLFQLSVHQKKGHLDLKISSGFICVGLCEYPWEQSPTDSYRSTTYICEPSLDLLLSSKCSCKKLRIVMLRCSCAFPQMSDAIIFVIYTRSNAARTHYFNINKKNLGLLQIFYCAIYNRKRHFGFPCEFGNIHLPLLHNWIHKIVKESVKNQ